MHRQASNKTVPGRGGHPPRPQQLLAVLAMGRTPGTGPAASAGPSRGSGVGVVLHELHVGIHHLPHQLLQGGREADEGPGAGDERTGSTSGAPWSTTSPPGPPQQDKEGTGLCWALPATALAPAPACVSVRCCAPGVPVTAMVAAVFKARTRTGSPKMGFLYVPESRHTEVPPSLPLPVGYKARQKGHSHQTWLSASSSAFVWLWYSPLAENPAEKKREVLWEASTVPTSMASPLLVLPCEPSVAEATVGLFRGQNISL